MRPAHSMVDGDTIFAMSTGSVAADLSVVGLLAARAMGWAVVAAIMNAEPLCGVPCCADLDAAAGDAISGGPEGNPGS